MDSFAVIIVAAGNSTRFGGPLRKTEVLINGLPIWWHALQPFRFDSRVRQLILVAPSEHFDQFRRDFSELIKAIQLLVIPGGSERFQSVELGLRAVDAAIDWVAVHDGARPCVDNDLVSRVFSAALQYEAAIAAIPVVATLKHSSQGDFVQRTVDRTGLWQAQTPQAYRKALLLRAFEHRGDLPATDESQLVEQLGIPVKMIAGSPFNLKVTHADDLAIAQAVLGNRTPRPAQAN